jgi:hypothetical protein
LAKTEADRLYHLFNDSTDNFISITANRTALVIPKQLAFRMGKDERERLLYGFNLAITTQID